MTFAGRKYEKYLPPLDYYAKGLYMIDIGQNDMAGAFYSKTLDQVLASIPSILETFEAGLKVNHCFFAVFFIKGVYLYKPDHSENIKIENAKFCRDCMKKEVETSGYTTQGL